MLHKNLFFTAFTLLAPCAVWADAVQPGIVISGGDDGTVIYFAAPPSAKQPVFLQKADSKGRTSCCTKIASRQLVRDTSEPPQLDELLGDTPIYRYRIAGEKLPLQAFEIDAASSPVKPVFVGVAMSAPNARAGDHAGLRSTLKTGRVASRAHLCFGTEGVNLISQAGKQSHAMYLPFGYEIGEVAPVCSKADLQVISQAD